MTMTRIEKEIAKHIMRANLGNEASQQFLKNVEDDEISERAYRGEFSLFQLTSQLNAREIVKKMLAGEEIPQIYQWERETGEDFIFKSWGILPEVECQELAEDDEDEVQFTLEQSYYWMARARSGAKCFFPHFREEAKKAGLKLCVTKPSEGYYSWCGIAFQK
ncbi:MAG: hypothetical protein OXR68_08130 [Alphaproteobacteria bacterium]|nr:hypothetical protein [Alphaproteobacteria bacterium]MDD9920573.1 hypothetical protein [Alphaproteobacteria bacterium]